MSRARPVILGIIPARGGSKGVPRKNVKKIAGKPLIAWTIEAARASRRLDRFLVSTEDAEIKKVSRKWGAEVLDRPKRLATDRAKTWDAVRDVLAKVPADVVVLLQPTSPVRGRGLIDACIDRFLRKRADNLATGFICKYKAYGTYDARRQDLDGFFYDDGSVYVVRADVLRAGRSLGRRIEKVVTSRDENVEIDEPFDFWLAQQVLSRRKPGL